MPFIYDALRKIARLQGPTRTGDKRAVVELIETLDDDSHIARLTTDGEGGFIFQLREEDITFTDCSVRIQLPVLEIYTDPVYVRKFKAFTRGGYPTPDIAGEDLP